jgi:fibronectin-binding autotransporter adhesin
MKTKTTHRFLALAAICMAMSGTASADNLYWDGNVSTANSTSDNSSADPMVWLSGGYWDNGTTSVPLTSWTGGDTAIFGGTFSGTQTVTLGSGISLGDGTTIGGADSSYLISVTGTGFNQLGNPSGTIAIHAGSTLSADAPSDNAHNLGPITLNGGTLTSANGPAGPANDGGYGNWLVRGVTAGGSSLSTISSTTLVIVSGSFTVADAVAGSGTDLLVSSKIIEGTLTKDGAGTMELTGANTYTGTTTISEGTLVLTQDFAAFDTSAIHGEVNVETGATLTMSNNPVGWGGGLTALNVNGGTVNGGGGLGAFGVTYNLTGGTISGAARLDLGQYGSSLGSINSLASDTTSVINISQGILLRRDSGQTSFTITTAAGSSPSGVDLQIDGIIAEWAGSCSLVKAGSGTLLLKGDNTYTGTTIINGGTLVLKTPDFNTYRGGQILINNGSTLKIEEGGGNKRYDFGAQTYQFDTIGGGTITTGSDLNWVAQGDWTFKTDGGAKNIITGGGGMNMNARSVVLDVARGTDAASDLDVGVGIGNTTGGLTKSGAGIATLSGGNSYTGATTVDGGTLALASDLSVGSTSGVFVNNGGTLLLKTTNALRNPNPRAVTIASGGLMTMDGDYSENVDTITLNVGELGSGSFSDPTYGSYYLNGDVVVGTGTSTISAVNVVAPGARTFTVAAGGTLNVTGTLVTKGFGDALGVIKAGDGTMILAGENTYTGDTTVNAGALAVNGTSLPDGTKLTIDGGTVVLTGEETVDTLFFGLVQQGAGTYSANGTQLTGSGTLVVMNGPAAGYASWMAPFITGGLTGDTTPGGDPENDGMTNLLEYALNGNPSISDPSIQPDPVVTAMDFEFTYSRLDLSLADTTQIFEYGSNLTGWTPVIIPAGPGVEIPVGAAKVTIIDTGTTDSVTISIPKSVDPGGKLFGRLKVVK